MNEHVWIYARLIGGQSAGWFEGKTALLLDLTSILVGSVLVLLLCAYGYIIWDKHAARRRSAVKSKWLHELSAEGSALRSYFDTGEIDSSLLDMSGDQQVVLQDILLLRLTQGPKELELARIRSLSWRVFESSYRTWLESRKWSERVNTLLYVEQFHMTELLPKLEEMLRSSSCTPLERFIILRMYSRTGYMRILKELLRKDTLLSNSQYLQILLPLTDEMWTRLMDHFKGVPYQVQCTIIDALRIRDEQSVKVITLLEALILGEDAELRTRSFQALAHVDRKDNGLLRRLLLAWNKEGDERARSERLVVARLMGSMREEAFIPWLKKLMGDPSFQIRQEAANSLARYEQAVEELRFAALEHPDKYARQIAEETLERKQYGRKMD
ncbi:HEAT repeat domain-containing protein [Paenibacillus pabuli]|uniref:HEAT repeat domain-containing protein n=1 Tax=Paenibacillus pabuli TaxID=1472 RepID=UPI001FFED33D|nr:HEAT repeat domain-containing protein [Paenibacillus pabuli]UPK44441.1 HEAT repeat domain-containing protein [Paenibacillus pabuli]